MGFYIVKIKDTLLKLVFQPKIKFKLHILFKIELVLSLISFRLTELEKSVAFISWIFVTQFNSNRFIYSIAHTKLVQQITVTIMIQFTQKIR